MTPISEPMPDEIYVSEVNPRWPENKSSREFIGVSNPSKFVKDIRTRYIRFDLVEKLHDRK